MKKIMGFAVVAGMGFLSLGCAAGTSGGGTGGSGETVPIVTYVCTNKQIRTQTVAEGKTIKLTLPEGKTVDLNAVEGSSGTKFSDGTVTFVLKGKEASVEFSSGRAPIKGCVSK